MAVTEITFRIPGLKDVAKYIKRLQGGVLKKAHAKATYEVARTVRSRVSAAYVKNRFTQAEGTLASYTRPPIGSRGYRSASSLNRSGLLSRSVVVRKITDGYDVMIDPQKKYPDGKLVSEVAGYMELGYTQIIQLNGSKGRRVLAYLHALRKTREGKMKKADRQDRGTLMYGTTIAIRQPARPIWKPVFARMRQLLGIYGRELTKYLKNKAITQGDIPTPPRKLG